MCLDKMTLGDLRKAAALFAEARDAKEPKFAYIAYMSAPEYIRVYYFSTNNLLLSDITHMETAIDRFYSAEDGGCASGWKYTEHYIQNHCWRHELDVPWHQETSIVKLTIPPDFEAGALLKKFTPGLTFPNLIKKSVF